jgi:hypothetical protein
MNRRRFLMNGAAAACMAGIGRSQQPNNLERVAVMTSYFGRRMPDIRDHGAPTVKKDLNLLDFPEMIADHFHLHNLEVQQMYFPATGLAPFLSEFRDRLKKAKSRVTNMPLEFDDQGTPGIISVCSPDPQIQKQALAMAKQWVDHAAFLGSPSVMMNQGPLQVGNLAPAIAGLKALSDYGRSRKIAVLIENRAGATPETLVEVIKASGIYANPDIGNWPDEATRERGLRLLYPLARNSHVKLAPERFDFAKIMEIPKQLGYKGHYSIEAAPTLAPDAIQAVQIVLNELVKVI